MAIVGALAVMASLGFGRFGYTILLPATVTGLHLTFTEAGLLGTANLAGYFIGSLGAARFPVRGPRTAVAVGLSVVAGSLVWMGLASGMTEALAARGLAGMAGALVYVEVLGLVTRFPAPSRGLISGVMHTGNGAGLVLAGLGLPAVIDWSGWRAGWVTLGLASSVVIPAVWLTLGSAASSTLEMREPSRPDVAVDAEASLWTYAGLYGLFGLSYIIYVTFFALALRGRELSLNHAGLAWAAVGVLSLASGPIWGSLSDRSGRLPALALLFGLHALAYVAFLSGMAAALVASVVIFGVTAWGVPAVMAAVTADRGPATAIVAFGFVTSVMSLGQAVGPAVAGIMGDFTSAPDSGLWISLGASAAASVWSLGGSLRSRRPRSR